MDYRNVTRHSWLSLKAKSAQLREKVFKTQKDTKPVARLESDSAIEADWAAMSALEQRQFFGENGFLVVPEAISKKELEEINQEICAVGLSGLTEHIWTVRSFFKLIDNKRVLPVLQNIFGCELRFFKGAFTDSPPRMNPETMSTRTGFHVDYGVGEADGDFRNSCASWVNVGYYLTELTPENSPLWIVPGSNRDYSIVPCSDMEHMAKDAKMVLAKAGDAIFFHCMTVHAGGYNVSHEMRRAVYFSYRPAWARHIGPVPEWPEEFIESVPPERRKLLVGLNKGL